MPQVKPFLGLTETENIEIIRIKNMMGAWNYSFFAKQNQNFSVQIPNSMMIYWGSTAG